MKATDPARLSVGRVEAVLYLAVPKIALPLQQLTNDGGAFNEALIKALACHKKHCLGVVNPIKMLPCFPGPLGLASLMHMIGIDIAMKSAYTRTIALMGRSQNRFFL
jgi:hypothetical protein